MKDIDRSRATPATALLASVMLLCACSTSAPVVYSEKRQTIEMDERTRKDLAQCSQQADARIGRNGNNARQVASKSGQVAGVGFVATAVGSLVATSRGAWDRARGAAAAGAAGMASKLLLEWNEPDKVYQGYVERCLESRGHEVLGWR